MGKPSVFPLPLPEWLAPLNRAYAQVEPRMRRREVLEEGRGVLWRDECRAPSALFPFRDDTFHFEGGAVDLMTGERKDGLAPVVTGHIYAYDAPTTTN